MKDSQRICQIDELKRTILISLDKLGQGEISFGELLNKLESKRINYEILKKYLGLLYDDDFIDINSSFFKSRAQIKSSIARETKIQLLSRGQSFAYNKRNSEISTGIEFNLFKIIKLWFSKKTKK